MPSVKNPRLEDIDGINGKFNERDKSQIVVFSKGKPKNLKGMQWLEFSGFRERRCAFSLDLRSIGPSVLDGATSKVVLRCEGYSWAPIWCSSDNSKR